MEILKLKNLSKYYASPSSVVMGLSNLNLSFSVGEFVAVTGESGSGKSTLAKILGGLLPYETGELYLEGRPTSHYDDSDRADYRRDLVGFISQSYDILPGNTVKENVESALRFSGVSRREASERASAILRKVDLSHLKTRRAAKLSSGQKQRLSIARALAKPSRILIADEPTGNLDRENSETVITLLKQASRDRLVILITHEFEEAKDVATRRITLSDGAVVADVSLREAEPAEPPTEPKPIPVRSRSKVLKLAPYTAWLTAKARPAFSAVLCLLLVFTSFLTFALLGTFIVALDDSSTRIYDGDAFLNGDPDRIVVMKPGGALFDEEELSAILSIPYVNRLETRGYVSDISYYYRPDTDYYLEKSVVNGPNYHPVLNPDDFQVTDVVKFVEKGLFCRTASQLRDGIPYRGDLPVGVYEVLSADPAYRIGDTLTVYFRNKGEWSVSASIHMTFTVVGETDGDGGLYLSDAMAAALTRFSSYAPVEDTVLLSREQVLLLPHNDTDPLAPGEIRMSKHMASKAYIKPGQVCTLSGTAFREQLTLTSFLEDQHPQLVLVNEELYHAVAPVTPDDQISIFIKDYAYADRVMDKLGDMGYLSLSPFRLGATETDQALAIERLITLGICLGALVLIILLQLILLRTMFGSLNDHLRLLSHIGLSSATACLTLLLLLAAFGVAGELLGATTVVLLNGLGVSRIVDIFKYMEAHHILALFGVHVASVCLAFGSVMTSMRKQIFAGGGRLPDLDLAEEEEA